MPLPTRKKLGFKYAYQPVFTQQLGIYPPPPDEVTTIFYKELLKHFSFADIQLNASNPPARIGNIEFIPRNNYLLGLEKTYTELVSGYSTNTKRNISKAGKNSLQFISGIQTEEYLHFNKVNLNYNIRENELKKLKRLITFGQFKGFGQICGVYSQKNELCAAVYFCRWKNRIVYLNAVSDDVGKENGGMFLLVDTIIKMNAESDAILDFEGSMIPGVARFYAGFGASPEKYYRLKFNQLPWPLKLLKK